MSGYDQSTMISYTIAAIVVGYTIDIDHGRRVAKGIKNGELSGPLLKPVNYLLFEYFSCIGSFFVNVIVAMISILPMLLYSLLVTNLSWDRVVLFTVSLFLGMTLYSQMYVVAGLITFWVREYKIFNQIVRKIVKFFAGGVIPLKLMWKKGLRRYDSEGI